MTDHEEQQRIEDNLAVIRSYLRDKFPEYDITEDSPYPSMYHKFAITNLKLYKCYKLHVSWPRLSDLENTPAKTRAALDHDDVAGRMIAADGDRFYW